MTAHWRWVERLRGDRFARMRDELRVGEVISPGEERARRTSVLREKYSLRTEHASVVAPMSVEIDKTPRGAARVAQFPSSR